MAGAPAQRSGQVGELPFLTMSGFTQPLPFDHSVIGTCSICGGAVKVHSGPWFGVVPPTPSCSNCGATPAQNHGPVIPMVRDRSESSTKFIFTGDCGETSGLSNHPLRFDAAGNHVPTF